MVDRQAQTNYWYFHMTKCKTACLKMIHRVMIDRVGEGTQSLSSLEVNNSNRDVQVLECNG